MITHRQARNVAALYAGAVRAGAGEIVTVCNQELHAYMDQFPRDVRIALRLEFCAVASPVPNFTNEKRNEREKCFSP